MAVDLQSPLVTISVVLLFLIIASVHRTFKRNGNLPPGPRGLPIIGSALQLPKEHVATYFKKLQAQYGNLVYLDIMGTPSCVISDFHLAKELLEKRSAQYSSRPQVLFFNRYIDPSADYWGSIGQGETHFYGRKISAGLMSTVKAGKSEAMQRSEAVLTIQDILDDGGQGWYQHVSRGAASATLGAMFGKHYRYSSDPELKDIIRAVSNITDMLTPSASIINIFPFLDYIPGPMSWRRRGLDMRERDRRVFDLLISRATSRSSSGIQTWTAAFADDTKGVDRRHLVKSFAVAAIDTTALSIHTFVLACLLYPDFVKTAQKQIDAIVGTGRLPTFEDRPLLPYVEAVLREVLRWRPGVRFGLPHETTAADEHVQYNAKSYIIPKRTTIYFLVWAIEHDETRVGPEPDVFRPERFLNEQGQLKDDYETSAFGFGKRKCVGVPFAERAIFINVALLLWTFDISKSTEVDPQTGLPFHYSDSDEMFDGSLTNGPHQFPAIFKPRDSERMPVVRREWEDCEKDLHFEEPNE